MTSAETSVTREGMARAADRMEATLRRVQSERGDVERSVTTLFGSFTGGAATTYRQAMTGWYNNVQEIENALSDMIRIMREGSQTVAKSAADTEADAAEGAARINAGPVGLANL
ncbi:WXG100 family type VII secretion target [Lentzea sp.]|uniref:WXG100 family type VII secretion target n=1 Tax=Lentzea sp. TaxID=56099 RepID=UPI002CA2ECFB|nr:WXG100 family type VII secretion target [Lentzea sp.]HUQ54856.1 WXG100 family type VII secretion target [Lentzea sp.]